MATMTAGLPKFMGMGLEAMKAARAGLPQDAGLDIDPTTGQIVDMVTRRPVTTDMPTYMARAAGMKSAAEEGGRTPFINQQAAFKGGVEMGVNRDRINQEAAHDLVPVVGDDGLLHNITRQQAVQAAAAGKPVVTNFAPNPYREAQIKEQTQAQTDATDAAKQQAAVQGLGAALAQFPAHGKLGPMALNVFKTLDSVGLASPELQQQVANGELANMDANAVVAAIAKAASAGRVPLGIYNQVRQTKPGIESNQPGMMLEALNQDFQRAQDLAEFKSTYYADPKNSTKLDADVQFNKTHPIAMYQSRVQPLQVPSNPANRQVGYTYVNNQGVRAVWTGQGWSTQ
jgi:hypothetical protein